MEGALTRLRLGGAVLFLCLLAPALLVADVYSYHFDGTIGNAYGGYYVSPYKATNVTLGQSLLLYCLDFNNYAVTNWEADLRPLAQDGVFKYSSTPVSSFIYSFGELPVLDRYLTAAYLFSLPTPDERTRAVNQYAVWSLLVLNTSDSSQRWTTALNNLDGTFKAEVNTVLTSAVANRASVDRTAWAVVVPTNPANSQEFLTRVPEPFELTTLAFGIMGMGLFWRRRSI